MNAATFSPYNDKSSAKRGFARKFKDMNPQDVESYLDKKDGKWGFSFDDKGPVLSFVAPAETKQPLGEEATEAAARASDPVLAAALEQHDEAGNDAAPSAFGAFALAQLTAPKAPDIAAPAARPAPIAKIEKNRPESNGVKRPSAGTVCAAVWDLATSLSKFIPEGSDGSDPGTEGREGVATLGQVVKAAVAKGINQYTARTQYARWRVFHGITGRIAS